MTFHKKKQKADDTPPKLLRTQTKQMTVHLANTPTPAESLLHSLDQPAGGISLYVNADKTEYIRFHQKGDNSTLKDGSLKLVHKFTYLGSSVSSTESDINMGLAKA